MENFKFVTNESMFKFQLEESVVYKAMIYTIVGRGQYLGLPANRYLLQRWDEEIGLDFTAGTWAEENEIEKK